MSWSTLKGPSDSRAISLICLVSSFRNLPRRGRSCNCIDVSPRDAIDHAPAFHGGTFEKHIGPALDVFVHLNAQKLCRAASSTCSTDAWPRASTLPARTTKPKLCSPVICAVNLGARAITIVANCASDSYATGSQHD
jgi:hypothetical protein